MNERRMQFRVGVVVFATMIVGAVLSTLNSRLPSRLLPGGRYEVGVRVPGAPGVGPNTPVRKNGLLIGRVDAIEDLENGVVLRAEIDADRQLMTNHVPHIRTSVLGDATIDFVTTPTNVPPQPIPSGTVIDGIVDPHPFDSIAKLGDLQEEFAAASRSLATAGDEVAKLARRVNTAFGDETDEGRVTRMLDTTERAMTQFEQTMASFNEIFGDEPIAAQPPIGQAPLNGQPQAPQQQPIDGRQMRMRLRQGLYELPDAVHETRLTLRDFRVVLESAHKNFKNLEGFTEVLGTKGDVFAEAMLRLADGLDTLIRDFNVLVGALNSREGTIGRLIYEPQAYENLNKLMCNANVVLGNINDLTARLRVVVEDARVFMDKVAREPGRVITGGLNPSLTK